MKITNQELDLLIDEFKKLVRADVQGITSSDARNTVHDWLTMCGDVDDMGHNKKADRFNKAVFEYQISDEIMGAE